MPWPSGIRLGVWTKGKTTMGACAKPGKEDGTYKWTAAEHYEAFEPGEQGVRLLTWQELEQRLLREDLTWLLNNHRELCRRDLVLHSSMASRLLEEVDKKTQKKAPFAPGTVVQSKKRKWGPWEESTVVDHDGKGSVRVVTAGGQVHQCRYDQSRDYMNRVRPIDHQTQKTRVKKSSQYVELVVDDGASTRRLPKVYTQVARRILELDTAIVPKAKDGTLVKHARKELGVQSLHDACKNTSDMDLYGTDQLKSLVFHLFNCLRYKAVDITVLPDTGPGSWHARITTCATPLEVLGVMLELEKGIKPTSLTTLIGQMPRAAWQQAVEADLVAFAAPDVPRERWGAVCGICAADDEVVEHHPLFNVGLCAPCHEAYAGHRWWAEQGEDVDLTEHDCRMCAYGGRVYKCAACPSVMCESCILSFAGNKGLLEALGEAWKCPLCEPGSALARSALDAAALSRELIPSDAEEMEEEDRDDDGNRDQIAEWLSGNGEEMVNPAEFGKKKKLRVLSCFDGIGGAMVALKRLGLDIEVYYASETDEAAKHTLENNHNDVDIVHVGDVRGLTTDVLKSLGRIDLLIGGSPCSDLAVTKRDRQGLGGSASILFFEFVRIRTTLENFRTEDPLLVLFENVASMHDEDMETISRHFNMRPLRINAVHFSPARRDRYYWTNIELPLEPLRLNNQYRKLQQVLSPKAVALYEKAYCIRTWGGSSYNGTGITEKEVLAQAHDCNPVRIGPGRFRKLLVDEACRCLGFPRCYMDQSNACTSKQHAMVGSSFSVQVIDLILKPLKEAFETTDRYEDEYSSSEW